MTVRAITDHHVWADVVTACACPHSSFFQSWEWGEVQRSYGREVYRYVIEDGGFHGAVQFIVMPLSRGKTYLMSPRGPIFSATKSYEEFYRAIVSSEAFRRMVDTHKAVFWRFEPLDHHLPAFARRVADVQPAVTTVIELEQAEEDLLAAMKQKTRYNIRLAEKKNVSVEVIEGAAMADERWMNLWWELLEETSERHGIRHHGRLYYEAMFKEFGESGSGELLVASVSGEVAAMNLNARYGDTMTYLHGVSTQKHRSVMAPYALQWTGIRRAKEAGYRWYDFYGIAPEGVKDHRLAGVTRFKTGFGGQVLEYPGTFDFSISGLWYTIYRTVKRFRS